MSRLSYQAIERYMKKTPLFYNGRNMASGFTLIEVIMAIVVMAIIAVGVGSLLYQGTRSFEMMDTRRNLTGQGKLAMERMTREIRLVRCASGSGACTPTGTQITSMTADELRFVRQDYEGRGFRYDAPTQTLYLRQGSTPTDPEDILARNVSAFAFGYFKSNGTAATLPAEVWMVNVTMTLSSGAESVDFKASIYPRHFY